VSYYQAKNIRFHEVQGIADLLGRVGSGRHEKDGIRFAKNI